MILTNFQRGGMTMASREGGTSRPTKGALSATKAIDFLKRSELVNLDMPVADLADRISGLEEVAGYVLAWDKYVLVVGVAELGEVIQPDITR
jgi:hypothetical protein